MDDLLKDQFLQHPEVAPQITLYLFDHRAPIVEVVALNQKVEFQAKIISHMDKTCNVLRSRLDSLTNKANRLGKKQDKGLEVKVQAQRDDSVIKDNRKNDEEFSPENIVNRHVLSKAKKREQ